jgi:hypothetical protein
MKKFLVAEFLAYNLLKEEGTAAGELGNSDLLELARCRVSSIYGLPKCPSELGRLFANDLITLTSEDFSSQQACTENVTSCSGAKNLESESSSHSNIEDMDSESSSESGPDGNADSESSHDINTKGQRSMESEPFISSGAKGIQT